MPRLPNFPTTCGETKRLELAYLRQRGWLRPGSHQATLSWTFRGQSTGSIGLETHISSTGAGYLRLFYTLGDGTRQDYRILLHAVASNLPTADGRHRFYLVCPVSGRHASVLYLRDGTQVFAHRLAFPDERLYYDSQLEPKRFRGLTKYFAVDRTWERECRKGRKTVYRGKPTKWYASLLTLESRAAAYAAPAVRAFPRPMATDPNKS